jgi:hypothetical protein
MFFEARRKLRPVNAPGLLICRITIRDRSSLSLPSPGRFLPDLDRRRKPRGPFFEKRRNNPNQKNESRCITGRTEKIQNTFLKLCNIEQRVDNRRRILLFVLRLGSLNMTVDRERCLHTCSREAPCQHFIRCRPLFRLLRLSVPTVRVVMLG